MGFIDMMNRGEELYKDKNKPKPCHLEMKKDKDNWKKDFYFEILEDLCIKYLLTNDEKIILYKALDADNLYELRLNLKKLLDESNFTESFDEFENLVENKIKKTGSKTDIDERFYKPELLNEIHKKLDYSHKSDHKEKLAVFLIAISSYLKDPNDHCSGALKGDSSSGKDNAIKTVLSLIPKEDSFFLTRGTSSAIEDEANRVRIIAFSEINKHRDNGANNELTETFKQFAEGGINVIKKDASTGFRTTKHIITEQKSLLYGTTETESDDELETRYVVIPIKSSPEKNKIVVNDVLDKVSSEKIMDNVGENWITSGIRCLDKNLDVIIPFAHLFKQKIYDPEDGKEKYLFDFSKERIKRDAKRLLSLTKSIAWLYQKQRVIKNGYIYSEPSDFVTAIKIFADFFNLTYSGLDHRLQKTLECIHKNEGKHSKDILSYGFDMTYSNWVLRHKIQIELGIDSINTIKERIAKLKDLGRIETHWNREIPKGYLIQGVNQGVNRLSLPVSLIGIDTLLTGYLMGKNPYNNKDIYPIIITSLDDKQENMAEKEGEKSVSKPKIDTLKIDTLKLQIYTQIKQSEKPVSLTHLQEVIQMGYDLSESEFNEIISKMKESGQIYESRPGEVQAL